MKSLPTDWILRNWGDSELPKYELLNYLQSLYKDLEQLRLFPAWQDSYANYSFLKTTKKGIDELIKLTPRELQGLAYNPMGLMYKELEAEGMAELQEIADRIEFASPLLRKACQQIQNFKYELEAEVTLSPIGIYVLNRNEGLIFTVNKKQPNVWAWQYSCGLQTQSNQGYTALRIRPAGQFTTSLTRSLHDIKKECLTICGFKDATVSTWLAESEQTLPVLSTLKPMAMLKLAKELGLG